MIAHITCHHSRMPFDPVNYVPDELQSYAREWLPAAKKAGTPQTDFIQALEPRAIDTLTFEQLQRFWAHRFGRFPATLAGEFPL